MSLVSRVLQSLTSFLSRPSLLWATSGLVRQKSKKKQRRETTQLEVSEVLARPEDVAQRKRLQRLIPADPGADLSPINGVPSQEVRERRVRIQRPPKNAMQSGTNNLRHWQITFDAHQPRWENPLMGWCSTADPLSNVQVEFSSAVDAIAFCERNGWRWRVDGDAGEEEEEASRKQRIKNYGINFAYNKRTRVSTK